MKMFAINLDPVIFSVPDSFDVMILNSPAIATTLFSTIWLEIPTSNISSKFANLFWGCKLLLDIKFDVFK